MKNLGKLLCVLTCLMILSVPMAAWAAPESIIGTDAKTTARMEIWKSIQSGRAGSATVAIMDSGRIVYAEGFGVADRANSIPVERNTLFNIGSISKTYCATAIMLLVDEGKVNLDKPVTAYIPEFTMADERYRDITVRMLLNHSSGLPGGSYANSFGYQYYDEFLSGTLATLSQSHLKHRPGEMAVYCNDGFTLAEIIVERVSGQKFSQFLADRVFKPLDLRHTGLGAGFRPAAESRTLARYYDPKGRLEPFEVVSFLGSGGLAATAEDLCRFADTFSVTGKQILSAASRTEMRKNQPPDFWGKLRNPMISFGLGWDFTELSDYKAQGLSLLGKSGGTNQYTSMLYTLPDHRISVAVISTGPGSPSGEIALAVMDAYTTEKRLKKPLPKTVPVPVKAQPMPSALLEYEGYYAGNGGSMIKIILDTDKNTLIVRKLEGEQETPALSAVYNSDYFHDAGGNKFYFATVDQQRYLISSAKFDSILLQKIEPLSNPNRLILDMDGTQWLRRNVKFYEGSSSSGSYIELAHNFKQLDGYIEFGGVKKIFSPTYAGVSLPAVRDASELVLIAKDNRYWAWISGLLYMPADLAPMLGIAGDQAAIGAEGYNEWRKTSRDSILEFDKPVKSRIIVFDNIGTVLFDSVLDAGPVFAPAGSFIEMAGNAGDSFTVTLKPVAE